MRFLVRLSALFISFFFAGPGQAQVPNNDPGASNTTATTAMGVLRLQFLDSRTGAAVRPQRLMINGRAAEIADGPIGIFAIPLPGSRYDIQAEAEGYQPFSATAVVDGENTMVQTFELDPKENSKEEEEIPPHVGVLEGYVVDALTRLPLPGVQLQVLEKSLDAQSGSDGKYSFEVELGQAPGSGISTQAGIDGERLTVRASKEGYRPQEQLNVEVLRGQKRTNPIRLEPLSGDSPTSEPQVLDDAPVRKSEQVRSWMFDVTFE